MFLSSLRQSAASWVAKILFVLLIASFAAWGIGDWLRPRAQPPLATVGDVPISANQFNQAFNREFNRLRQAFGGQLDRDMAVQLGLPRQILDRMVSTELLRLEAAQLGIAVADHLVRARIQSDPTFQMGGRFDRLRFDQAMRSNNLTEEGFVESLRADLARAQLTEALQVGAKAPRAMTALLHAHRAEQRIGEVMLLPAASIAAPPEPSEADLANFHQDQAERFMAPEYRAVTAIVLSPEDVADQVDISPEQVSEAYDSRLEEFVVPERREVTQLLFKDEAAAKATHERLAGGASFAAVASEATALGANLTEIGDVRTGELFPELVEQAVFGLASAGVTEPVNTVLGWHLLKVDRITPASVMSYGTVSDGLRAELALAQAGDVLHGLARRLEDSLAAGTSLEEAATALKLRLIKVAAMDRGGMDPAGLRVEGLPPGPAAINTVFSLAVGREGTLTDTPDGGSFVVRVDGMTPSALKPLETVREQVGTLWRRKARTELGQQAAQALANQVAGGESFAELATAQKLETRVTAPFGRTMDDPQLWLPGELVRLLFEAKTGDLVLAPLADGFAIARLTDVRAADVATNDAALKGLGDQVSNAIGADLLAQFETVLRRQYGVTVNERALATMF